MTVINNQNTQINAICRKVVFHQFTPAFLFLLGNFRKTITGKIHEIATIVNGKIIHMNRLTGLIANPCKILTLQNAIDHRGFAHVGLAGESNFRQPGIGKILR